MAEQGGWLQRRSSVVSVCWDLRRRAAATIRTDERRAMGSFEVEMLFDPEAGDLWQTPRIEVKTLLFESASERFIQRIGEAQTMDAATQCLSARNDIMDILLEEEWRRFKVLLRLAILGQNV